MKNPSRSKNVSFPSNWSTDATQTQQKFPPIFFVVDSNIHIAIQRATKDSHVFQHLLVSQGPKMLYLWASCPTAREEEERKTKGLRCTCRPRLSLLNLFLELLLWLEGVSLWSEFCHSATPGCLVTKEMGIPGGIVWLTSSLLEHWIAGLVGMLDPLSGLFDWSSSLLKTSYGPID